MNVDEFYSIGCSINLPSPKAPKVTLAVDSASISHNAFQLYNPFSRKAKILKWIVSTVFYYANPLARLLFSTCHCEKTELQKHLEQSLETPLYLSVYRATAKDKVVLQLQTKNAEIIGYLKYPLNKTGVLHLENEKKAIDILSEKNIISSYKQYDYFKDKPFLLLEPLDGVISHVSQTDLDELLKAFKREKTFLLSEHPRIIQLQEKLITHNMNRYQVILLSLCQRSKQKYALVYEHGDFAPWNIMCVNKKYIPFDFEYFVEDGLEHFDLIKYHYQTAFLLEKKSGHALVEYICKKINLTDGLCLLQLFLIKEIIRCHIANETYVAEAELLEQLSQ